MAEIGGEVCSHWAKIGDFRAEFSWNTGKGWRYGIVGLIQTRGHLFVAYSMHGLGV